MKTCIDCGVKFNRPYTKRCKDCAYRRKRERFNKLNKSTNNPEMNKKVVEMFQHLKKEDILKFLETNSVSINGE